MPRCLHVENIELRRDQATFQTTAETRTPKTLVAELHYSSVVKLVVMSSLGVT